MSVTAADEPHPAAQGAAEELVALLSLEQLEENLFRGQSQDLGWGAVFGGQVLGQALAAATRTVPRERAAHSLHAYFLRTGDVHRPIVYDVDRIRDGSSFTTRRVVAIQAGRPIFNLAASFQIEEPGFSHQDDMPQVTPPEDLKNEQELAATILSRLPRALHERALRPRPIEIKPVDPPADPLSAQPRPPQRSVWLRAVGRLPEDPALQRCLLAYASDYSLIGTALLPHGVNWLTPGMQVASLDHVMWFHQPLRMDQWLLYVIDSPAAHGARGLARGRIFTREGQLVATTSQEGLIRQRPPRP